MKRIQKHETIQDIPQTYKNTAIEKLIAYHNFDEDFSTYEQAQILIGMCMDNRKSLRIPDNFAYILRTGGANLRYSEFKVSYAISVGGVQHIALIAHNHCGMVNLPERKELFIQGLIERGGWNRGQAEEHYHTYSHKFEIGNEIDFVLSEARRLRQRYPKITVAPVMYLLEDNKLYLVQE